MDKGTFESIMRGARQALAYVEAQHGAAPQQGAAMCDVVEHCFSKRGDVKRCVPISRDDHS